MAMPSKRPTQKDVARLAGVSTGTVSLVLNNKAAGSVPISEETRRKVFQAAEQLGYTLNPLAQMLARGTNNIIAVFTYETDFPYEQEDHHHPFLLGIEREASQQDYDVLLLTNHSHEEGHQIYTGGVNRLRMADGAVLLGVYPDRAELKRLVEEKYPFVFIGRREIPGYQIDWVVNDYITASHNATRHLLDLGHRSLGLIGFRSDTETAEDRLYGCQQALNEEPDAAMILLEENCLTNPAELIQQINTQSVTGLLCHDMHVYHQVMEILKQAGIRVPQDLSLVALEDGDGQVSLERQPTHVRLSKQRIGEHAIRILVNRLKGVTDEPQQVRIPCELIIGDTTASPPA